MSSIDPWKLLILITFLLTESLPLTNPCKGDLRYDELPYSFNEDYYIGHL
jgi:hypothetical protein